MPIPPHIMQLGICFFIFKIIPQKRQNESFQMRNLCQVLSTGHTTKPMDNGLHTSIELTAVNVLHHRSTTHNLSLILYILGTVCIYSNWVQHMLHMRSLDFNTLISKKIFWMSHVFFQSRWWPKHIRNHPPHHCPDTDLAVTGPQSPRGVSLALEWQFHSWTS